MARPAGLEPATHSLEVVGFSLVFNGGFQNGLDIIGWCRVAPPHFDNRPTSRSIMVSAATSFDFVVIELMSEPSGDLEPDETWASAGAGMAAA
jgi:hypothetical protein